MKKFFFIIFYGILLSSCANAPKVMTYYKELDEPAFSITTLGEANKIVTVNAFILEPESKPDKTVFDFSEKGQSAVIDYLGKKSNSPAEMYAALALPVKDAVQKAKISGSVIFKKRIVLNINSKTVEKADRLERIKITLTIPDALKDKIEFVSWDKIATETLTIDLGKIIGGNSTTASFSPEIGMSGTIQGKLAGTISNTKTFSEEKVFSEKMAGLNAALVNKNEFEINRYSMPNENLSGNIIVELSLKAKNQKQITYFDLDGLVNDEVILTDLSKAKVNKVSLIMPDFGFENTKPITNIPLKLSYDFRFRKVGEGKNTIPEYDDVVKYIDGSVVSTSPVILSDSEAWEVKLWEISVGDQKLHIQNADMPAPTLLSFTSYEKAVVLLNWIKKNKSLKVSDYSFYLAAHALKLENIKDLEITIPK